MQSTSGLISARGVYLSGNSFWFAQFGKYPYLRFSLTVESPIGWKVISQGKHTQLNNIKGSSVEKWESSSPQEEIYLVAAKFTEYNRDANNIKAQVFLRQPDKKLAGKYLEATIDYISMYETLLGPYLYSKFALVENFWETGYGMPSFTLLGSRVIRLPFILYSSYPHEILHNWWGNGVYVDFRSGNWSEGLTAYLADHLIKQQHGKAASYRLQSLQKYNDYAAKSSDFPLTQFRGRHSSASAAVGYGKTLMLFNMLRQQIGDELFIKSLRQLYLQHKFKVTTFDDLQKIFEQQSGEDLTHFFHQWVNRTGAPELILSQSKVIKTTDGFQLNFELKQMQQDDVYHLKIPMAVTLDSESRTHQSFVFMSQKKQQFTLSFKTHPLRLDIDPEFDLFRKLAIEETPPAFTQLFGSKEMLVVLPRSADSALQTAWKTFALNLSNMGPEKVTIKWDDELNTLPEDQAVTILGWKNIFAAETVLTLSDYNVTHQPGNLKIGGSHIDEFNHSVALTLRHKNYPRSFIATGQPNFLENLARKLPHYHKYSYLAFSGNEATNKLKGRWSVSHSPMTAMFKNKTPRGTLAKRPALIEPR
jgi:aminopeptidase N